MGGAVSRFEISELYNSTSETRTGKGRPNLIFMDMFTPSHVRKRWFVLLVFLFGEKSSVDLHPLTEVELFREKESNKVSTMMDASTVEEEERLIVLSGRNHSSSPRLLESRHSVKAACDKNKKNLPGGELNPGLPRDRRGY